MQKQRHHQPQLRLLPHYFKFIGSGIAVIGFIIICIIGEYNNIRGKVLLDMINIGCLLICFSKERIEDELLMLIRLQSAAYALIFSVLFVVIFPLYIFIHDGRNFNFPDFAFVLGPLLLYSSTFEYKKRRM